MSADDLWAKLDALPWPAPWVAHTFEIECPCPNGADCGDSHTCEEVEAPQAYPWSPQEPAGTGEGQCVVQLSTPGLDRFARPCAEFIAAARNELPGIRAKLEEVTGERDEARGNEDRLAELFAATLRDFNDANRELTSLRAESEKLRLVAREADAFVSCARGKGIVGHYPPPCPACLRLVTQALAALEEGK